MTPKTQPGTDRVRGIRVRSQIALTSTGIAWLLLPFLLTHLQAETPVVENLGVVERQARVLGYAVSPGTTRYPPRLLVSFEGRDGTWIVNLRDGTSKQAKVPGLEKEYLQWPTFIGADGKVFTSCGRGGLSVYDPLADTIKVIRPIPEARWLRGIALGPDGSVYVSDYPTGTAAKYDPKSEKITRFGRQGGPFTIKHIYGYSIGSDGRFVYTAVGKIPWYVVAFDTNTGKQKNLFRFEPADHPEVHQRGDLVFLDVKHGSPKAGKPSNSRFRLVDGRVERVETIPRFDDSYVPGNDRPQTSVQRLDRSLPVGTAGATIKYRIPGKGWTATSIPVSGGHMTVERIAPSSDGRLLLSTGPYGNVHRFDPKTGSFTRLGNPASKNVYDLMDVAGRIYFCGYPNSILGSFGAQGGSLIGNWHDNLGSKHAVFIVRGADGRIYSGNHHERESTGGSLGWYDPKSGKFGGLHFPNDDCEYLTTAVDGRYIVYASDFSFDAAHPEIKKRSGKLIIYDSTTQRVVREISPLADGSAGVLVETEPGVMLGVGLHDKLPMAYTVDIRTGKLRQRASLPARVLRLIAAGPDGKVYLFSKDVLLRVDPNTLAVESLGAVEPGRMVFLQNDLYLAGTTQLRRITNITQLK